MAESLERSLIGEAWIRVDPLPHHPGAAVIVAVESPMPLFDFQCTQCGAIREVLLYTGQSDPAACEACGAKVRRLVSAPADLKRMDGFFHKDNPSDAQLASKGLAKYVNRGDGTYEKASGSGPSIMSRDQMPL